MMRLSARTEYGIRAMIDLALHSRLGPVQSHDIAERQEMPEPYLNQILTLLRKAGLISSRRGPGGGHALARPPSEIDLAEIVSALEGPLFTPEAESGRTSRTPGLDDVWQEVAETTERILRRVTLAEIVEREQSRAYTYQI